MGVSVPNILAARAAAVGGVLGVGLRVALRVALGVVVLGAAGCATTRPPYDYATEPDPRTKEEEVRDRPLGRPARHGLAQPGPVGAADRAPRRHHLAAPHRRSARRGATPGRYRNEVTQRLGAFLKDESAIVTVAVTAIHSYRFVVSGNVEKQGEISADHFVTVAEAIALAGGPNKFATAEETVIMRPDATKGTRRIPIDYPAILSGTHPEQDLPIMAGNMIPTCRSVGGSGAGAGAGRGGADSERVSVFVSGWRPAWGVWRRAASVPRFVPRSPLPAPRARTRTRARTRAR